MPEGKETQAMENTPEAGVDKGPEVSRDTDREGTHQGGDHPDTTPVPNEDLKRSNEVMTKAMELIERQRRRMEEMEQKLASYNLAELRRLEDRVEELTDRLPKTVRDEKAQIKGYYDFDGATRKYASEATEADYREAKANLDAIIKGAFNG